MDIAGGPAAVYVYNIVNKITKEKYMKKFDLTARIISLVLWAIVAIISIVYWIKGWEIHPVLYAIATMEVVVLNIELLCDKLRNKGDK